MQGVADLRYESSALLGLVGKMYSKIQSSWRVSGTNHKDTKIDRSYTQLNLSHK